MSQILTTSESESVPASDIMPNFSSIASNSGTIKFIILDFRVEVILSRIPVKGLGSLGRHLGLKYNHHL